MKELTILMVTYLKTPNGYCEGCGCPALLQCCWSIKPNSLKVNDWVIQARSTKGGHVSTGIYDVEWFQVRQCFYLPPPIYDHRRKCDCVDNKHHGCGK